MKRRRGLARSRRACSVELVAVRSAPARSPRRDGVGGVERAALAQRPPESGSSATRVPARSTASSSAARSSSAAAAAASPRSSARRPRVASRRPPLERERAASSLRPSSDAVAVRLLEVVADDLVVPGELRAVRAASSQSARRACSSARSSFGIDAYATSRISTWLKRKPSSPGKSERSGRTNSLRASASRVPPTPAPAPASSSSRDGAAVEEPPLDRGALEDGALLGLEPVDARGEQRLDRRRHGVPRRPGRRRACASICSTKSGLPSAVATIRSRNCRRELVVAQRALDELVRLVAAERLERRRASRPGCGAAQDGRTSKRSGRASAEERRSARRSTRPATYSSRSSSAGSAQWMSSTTTTSGRAAASVSNSRRNAQAVSSGEPAAVARADRAGDEPRRDVAVPVRERSVEPPARSSPATSRTTSASGR